jgi:hypothetical protein
MGVDSASVKFLCAAKSIGVDFTDTAMIGRQAFVPNRNTLRRFFSIMGIARDPDEFLRDNKYSEQFFTLLGAKQIASVDFSKFEGATHIHNMNLPIPETLRARFSVVHDGGTLEHIFNIPQALKNCMEMVKVGGHFTQVSIANNYMGHGFWQFSPEMVYRVFSPQNGFHVEVILLHEVVPGGGWYVVLDPEQVGQRVELCNSKRTYILTVARRVAESEIFASAPQQSDYVANWNRSKDAVPYVADRRLSTPLRQRIGQLRQYIPRPLKRALRGSLELLGLLKKTPEFDTACYRWIKEETIFHGLTKSYLETLTR